MIAVRPAPSLRFTAAPRPDADVVTAVQCAQAGLDTAALFGWNKVAFRRVESVRRGTVALELGDRTARLPMRLHGLQPGQWVKLERLNGGAVRVSLDLPATLRGEARLVDLFTTLTSR